MSTLAIPPIILGLFHSTTSRGFQSCPAVGSQPSAAAHHGFAEPRSEERDLNLIQESLQKTFMTSMFFMPFQGKVLLYQNESCWMPSVLFFPSGLSQQQISTFYLYKSLFLQGCKCQMGHCWLCVCRKLPTEINVFLFIRLNKCDVKFHRSVEVGGGVDVPRNTGVTSTHTLFFGTGDAHLALLPPPLAA